MASALLFMAVLSQAASAQTAQRFFSLLPDMPVAPGLSEIKDQSAVFDKPEGRIVDIVAELAPKDLASIRDFYAQTLPQLGWRRLGPSAFTRGAEHLILTDEPRGARIFLHFVTSPAPPVMPAARAR